MRCKMLALTLPALSFCGSLAVLAAEPSIGSSSPTISVVQAAAEFKLVSTDQSSPSDRSVLVPQSTTQQPSNVVQPVPVIGQAPSWNPVPDAPGPSLAPSPLQRYLNCDPHSCPDIWQGYETQRAAELAMKCTPPSARGGCSCGGLCGGSGCGLIPAPTSGCATCGPARPLNRYRIMAPVGSEGCASCDTPASSGGCDSCQASAQSTSKAGVATAPQAVMQR
jgi:hypothetical protein